MIFISMQRTYVQFSNHAGSKMQFYKKNMHLNAYCALGKDLYAKIKKHGGNNAMQQAKIEK